jgi:hypothetical protein
MCSGSVSSTCSTSVTQRCRSGSYSMCAWGVKFLKHTSKITTMTRFHLYLKFICQKHKIEKGIIAIATASPLHPVLVYFICNALFWVTWDNLCCLVWALWFFTLRYFWVIWPSVLSTLSVPNRGYSSNASCALI